MGQGSRPLTTRTFAAWVEPVARELREGRGEIARTARKFLPEMWTMPSPLEGWTYKDLLAHLATGDWVFQTMLRQTLGIENALPAQATLEFVNEGNARLLAERKDTSIEELIAEGDAVVARYTSEMRDAGGKTISVRGMTYYRLTDGKIVEDDPVTTPDLAAELGGLLAPATA